MEVDSEMSKKRRVNRLYPIYSVIIGVLVILLYLFDNFAIEVGAFGDDIGFLSLVFISPIGLVFGLMGLNSKENRYVSILGIGINLSEVLYLLYIMTHFAP